MVHANGMDYSTAHRTCESAPRDACRIATDPRVANGPNRDPDSGPASAMEVGTAVMWRPEEAHGIRRRHTQTLFEALKR